MTGDASFVCPACDGAASATVTETGRRAVVRCTGCGLQSTWPRLDAGAARRRYAEAYYSNRDAARFRVPVAEGIARWFRRHRASALARALGGVNGKRILDVGCGRGHTLRALRQLGADVFGTQVAGPAARAAAAEIGAGRVHTGDLADAPHAAGSFDSVTLWHVLEHVEHPGAMLLDVARLLKPGGMAYIEVPNAGGWTARTYGAAWLAWDLEHHVSHFTAASLMALAAKAGLTPIREVHLSLEYSPVTLVQTWLNRWLGGDNRLFAAVTFAPRPSESPGAGRVPLGLHVLVAMVAFPAAVAASLWLAARGDGDTLGVYFRKA